MANKIIAAHKTNDQTAMGVKSASAQVVMSKFVIGLPRMLSSWNNQLHAKNPFYQFMGKS